MGKRSRARAQEQTGVRQTREVRRPAAPPPKQRAQLGPVRRTLTAYLLGALLLGVLTLAGIVVLGGTLGPFITLAVVVLAAGLLHRAATLRLAPAELTNEDRLIQTMAGGMLVLSVVLAAAGAVLSLVA
ncbi:MAG: hypothetical protein JWO90_3088 [Solirubrobacterales bacterium]|jgi:hypothetical protein|nr:hypothetical protein [Solirubrobacterales bacterium]